MAARIAPVPPAIRNSNPRLPLPIAYDDGQPLSEDRRCKIQRATVGNVRIVVKTLKRRGYTAEEWALCSEEYEKHVLLLHPHIIRMFTCLARRDEIRFTMESARMDLFDLVVAEPNQRIEDERRAAKYVSQIASALQYCHDNNIIHRDVKIENVLVDSNGNMKLCDFGLSIRDASKLPQQHPVGGTTEYYSPEEVAHGPYDFRIDIWALGILTYELLVGKTPFYARNKREISRRIAEEEVQFPDDVELTTTARRFVTSLLRKKPNQRMTLESVPRHPWIDGKKRTYSVRRN